MDLAKKHKEIVKSVVLEIADMASSSDPIEVQTIIDEERGHYILFSVGWENTNWVYGTFVHIDVKVDGKVWLQHDGTDLKVGDLLIQKGIPKNQIVVGFQPPHMRELMDGFAVA
jgi:hypothetical protein